MWGVFAVLFWQFSGASTLHVSGLGQKKFELATTHTHTLANKEKSMGVLARIIDAYHSRKGLLVSVGLDVPKNRQSETNVGLDVSATVLRDDVPWWLYPVMGSQDVKPPSFEAQGVIFDPASPPAVACAYPADGTTGHRKPDRCGLDYGIQSSGRCRMPPSDYMNFEDDFFRGRTCHFDTVEEALEAQRAYWMNRTAASNTVRPRIAPYNEIILNYNYKGWDFLDSEKVEEHIAARFWGHAGPFRMPTKHDDKTACRLKKVYNCSSLEAPDNLPLFEFAELWGGGYQQASKFIKGGATEIIREMDPATICALDCPQ